MVGLAIFVTITKLLIQDCYTLSDTNTYRALPHCSVINAQAVKKVAILSTLTYAERGVQMVDLRINVDRSPIENNAPPRVKSQINNPVSKTNSLPPRAKWDGVDRRRRLTARRGTVKRKLLLEMRQRADRRKSASLNVKV